ncbi:MAG: hypothetical protein ABIG20_01445 [archaeon]
MIVVMSPMATEKEVKKVVDSLEVPKHDLRVTRILGKIVIVANGKN